MCPRCSLLLAVLFMAALAACGQASDREVQAASDTEPMATTQLGRSPEAAELAPDEAVAWLDDAGDANAKEIDWDALIPADWQPATLMADVDIDNLSDDDPRAQALLDKLKALWSDAPVVPELAGQRVRLPGFVVPLEMDATKIDQFLLVPYYGACIHVPPPPSNQTVHVVTDEGKAFEGRLFDVVWVTGTMRVERLSSDLAEAGYRLENASVVPYE